MDIPLTRWPRLNGVILRVVVAVWPLLRRARQARLDLVRPRIVRVWRTARARAVWRLRRARARVTQAFWDRAGNVYAVTETLGPQSEAKVRRPCRRSSVRQGEGSC